MNINTCQCKRLFPVPVYLFFMRVYLQVLCLYLGTWSCTCAPLCIKYLQGTCSYTCVPASTLYVPWYPCSYTCVPATMDYLRGEARKAFTLHPPSWGLCKSEMSHILCPVQNYPWCSIADIYLWETLDFFDYSTLDSSDFLPGLEAKRLLQNYSWIAGRCVC